MASARLAFPRGRWFDQWIRAAFAGAHGRASFRLRPRIKKSIVIFIRLVYSPYLLLDIRLHVILKDRSASRYDMTRGVVARPNRVGSKRRQTRRDEVTAKQNLTSLSNMTQCFLNATEHIVRVSSSIRTTGLKRYRRALRFKTRARNS